ncbi:MAG: hypothetical protein D3904_00185 [Candidatus Electrothrix sp. EH2]|nr:hypothetical protein [Candidatus Electrothrix sp. EH2]
MKNSLNILNKKNILISIFFMLYTFFSIKAIVSDSLIILFSPFFFIFLILFYNNPLKIFFIILYGTMLAGIFVSYIPELYNIRWVFTILSLIIGVYIIFHIIFKKRKIQIQRSNIFNVYSIFILYSIFFSIINDISFERLIISMKNNFQFYPIILFLFFFRFDTNFITNLFKSLFTIAILQPLIVLFQFFYIVPKIGNSVHLSGTSSLTVLDAVNGSFGTTMRGGGTGMFTIFTCVVLCGILASYNRRFINGIKCLCYSIYILIPLFLNETKAAFIFFLVGSTIISFDRNPIVRRKILFTILVALYSIAMIYATLEIAASFGVDRNTNIQTTLDYNIGSQGYGKYRLNRFTSLVFWWKENKNNLEEIFIGHGLDATIELEMGLSLPGAVAQQYPFYGTGLTTASQLLWETGIIGFTLFISIFLLSLIACVVFAKSPFLTNQEQYLALCVAAGNAISILLFFYDSSFRNSQPANLFCTMMVGLTIFIQARKKIAKTRVWVL